MNKVNSVEASKEAVSLVFIQYKMGLTNFKNLLDTQRALLNQQDNLIINEGTDTNEMIKLYKALGGGWNTNDLAANAN